MGEEFNSQIELVKPVYLKEGLKIPQFFRFDWGGKRFYYKANDDGSIRFYPSWTTIIGATLPTPPNLLKWYANQGGYENAITERDTKADYGTFLHIMLAEYLADQQLCIEYSFIKQKLTEFKSGNLNGEVKWIRDIQKDILAFAQFINDKQFDPIAIEIPLAGNNGVAGTIDLVGYMTFNRKRVRVIIDIKSGRKGFYENSVLQLHGYKRTWEDNFPDLPIDMLFNWAPKDWRETPDYTLENQTSKDCYDKLEKLIALFMMDNPPDNKRYMVEFTGTIKPGVDVRQYYRKVDVVDIIRKHHPERFEVETPAQVIVPEQVAKPKSKKVQILEDF